MMFLSELGRLQEFDVLRDAAVHSLGFVEIALPGRLVFAMNAENLALALASTGIAAVLTNHALASTIGDTAGIGIAAAVDPRRIFVALHNKLARETEFYGAPMPSQIAASARVHPRAHVDSLAVVIGADCRIDAGAIILAGSQIEAGAWIMAGAVLGSTGFQTIRFPDAVIDLEHAGQLKVGARSVVMANAVIARAVFRQATEIGADCRIGNGAFVSHNAKIGCGTLVGHGAIVAGNTQVGDSVTIGPGAVCLDRIRIGDRAIVTAGAVVNLPVEAGQRVSGNLAVSHDLYVQHIKRTARGLEP